MSNPADSGSGASMTVDRPIVESRGLNLVLLGTQAGPPPVLSRAGISSAVIVDGVSYVIDCGRSSVSQYQRAGLKYASLRNIFITHLHADHVCDYYNFFLLAGTTISGDQAPVGVQAYGPGAAGALPSAAGDAQVSSINPTNPTPGLIDLTESCHAAYAYSSNILRRGAPAQIRDIRDLVVPKEINIPDVGASALGETAPLMQPFVVTEDDRVRISAILVPHGDVFPAFAYRFDTDYGSITFSGDTRRSENVITLAGGSDILVHEAISLPAAGVPQRFAQYQKRIHTLVDEVGGLAQAAEVPHLVLSHLSDLGTPGYIDTDSWQRRASAGYSGRVTIGCDLESFAVGRGRKGSKDVAP